MSSKRLSARNSPTLTPAQEVEIFHKMIHHVADQVVIIHKDGRIVFLNDSAARGYGYSKKILLGKPITQFINEKLTLKQWQSKYFSRIKKQKSAIFTIERKIKGGKIKTVDVSGTYMLHKGQEYLACVARDVTVRLALESRLRESTELFSLLSEQAADGIFTADLSGKVVYANKAASMLVKIPVSKAIGTPFVKYVAKHSMVKALKSFKRVRTDGRIVRDELDIVDSKKKIIPVEYTTCPIYKNGKIAQIHTIVRDISRRRQIEQLLRDSQKNKALQSFVAGTANEIRHPLKGVFDHTQNLIRKYKDRSFEYIGYKEFKDILQTLEDVRDQSKYCLETADRLLMISRQKAGLKATHCDVNNVIHEAVNAMKPLFDQSPVKLILKLGSTLPPAHIGAIELNQIIVNVLTNAVQSIAAAGQITVKTAYYKKDKVIRIDCKDNGVGIPKEVLPRVFDPFFTTKQRGINKSSGLGLAIVYSLVKAFHGEVTVKSSLREGTRVTVTLPVNGINGRSRNSNA